MKETVDQFEVDPEQSFDTMLSDKEMKQAQFDQRDGWDICYNFLSEQVLIKKEVLEIIPLTMLRKSKYLHKEYWKRRQQIASEKYYESR